MSIVYANLSVKQKQQISRYWQYHIGRATGEIPLPNIEFNTLVSLSPESTRAWKRLLDYPESAT